MIFSYYYDTLKRHRLNCGIDVISIQKQTSNNVEFAFNAYIEEVIDGAVKKREQVRRTFRFPTSEESAGSHDLDMLRHRYADENKWVFEIRNNKDASQRIVIGLISDTALTNPLGLDILHEDDRYESELRANNLSAIAKGEVSPKITQTLVDADFATVGYPTGFESSTGTYNSNLRLIQATEFTQEFFEAIPAATPFKIEMNIAPETLDLKYNGTPFSEIEIPYLGTMKLYRDRFYWEKELDYAQEGIMVLYDEPLEVSDYYSNGFTPLSQMIIEGDGKGTLVIRYGGKNISTSYNPSNPLSELHMKGGVKA